MEGGNGVEGDLDQRPAADPTLRTIDLLRREMGALKLLMEVSLTGTVKTIEARLDASDKAIQLLQVTTDRIPTHIDEKVDTVRDLHEEKFRSFGAELSNIREQLKLQFAERDTRTEQTSRDSKVAVDAALQAQKEAANASTQASTASVSKMEAAFTKQLDLLGEQTKTEARALDKQINDLKERFLLGEGRGMGATAARTGAQANIGVIVAVAGVVLAFLAAFAGIMMKMN